MNTFLSLTAYCALGLALAGTMRLLTKTFWVFLLASATGSALLLQVFGYLYLGYVDDWAYIVFVPSWLIGLGCALTYHVLARMVASMKDSPMAERRQSKHE